MSKQAAVISLTAEEESTLNQWLRTGTTEHRLAERARMVLLASQGQSPPRSAQGLRDRAGASLEVAPALRAWSSGGSARCGTPGQAPPLRCRHREKGVG